MSIVYVYIYIYIYIYIHRYLLFFPQLASVIEGSYFRSSLQWRLWNLFYLWSMPVSFWRVVIFIGATTCEHPVSSKTCHAFHMEQIKNNMYHVHLNLFFFSFVQFTEVWSWSSTVASMFPGPRQTSILTHPAASTGLCWNRVWRPGSWLPRQDLVGLLTAIIESVAIW